MSAAMRRVWLLSLVVGCAAPRPDPARAALPAPATSPARPAPAQRAAKRASSITFTPRALPTDGVAAPSIEIDEPSFGDVLDPQFAASQAVRVRAEGAALAAPGAVLLVSLDGRHARPVAPEQKLTLADLLADQEELSPGAHLLYAVAVDGTGRALLRGAGAKSGLVVSGFYVGARSSDALNPSFPSLFCLAPAGTFYLKAGEPVPFQVLAVGAQPQRLPLRVVGPSGELETEVDAGRVYDLRGLAFGDSRISVGHEPGPRAECVVTVNPRREAGPP